MAKKVQKAKKVKSGWIQAVKSVSREEAIRRAEAFPQRREKFIASIRKGKGRNLSA